jgi:hypothetical protein
MEKVFFTDDLTYNNILYIGDNAKDCLKIIEKFTGRVLSIEKHYAAVLNNDNVDNEINHPLQRNIQYHFEGGVVIFKFKREDEVPAIVQRECLVACRNIAFEQLIYAS